MEKLKKLVGWLRGGERSSISGALIGALNVKLVRKGEFGEAFLSFRGHSAVLTQESPFSSFDIFKHGTVYIKIGKKRQKFKTKNFKDNFCFNCNGTLIEIGVREEKKKLSEEDFYFVKLIEKGTFGQVVLAMYKKSGRMYACKIIRKEKSKNSLEKIINEKNILTQIKSPFLIHLLASFQTHDSFYLVLPYIEGGELFHYLKWYKKFSEETARVYICELLLAVDYLHQNGIIYRDIKPENILLDKDGHAVLCDFGMSIRNTTAITHCGTPEYIAPEIIRQESYDESVDYYTLGVLLYEMACGFPPFSMSEGDDAGDLENKILFSEISYPEHVSPPLKGLIGLLLDKVPSKRPKYSDLIGHPFFSDIDWEKIKRKEIQAPIVPISVIAQEESQEQKEKPSEANQDALTNFTYCPDDWEDK